MVQFAASFVCVVSDYSTYGKRALWRLARVQVKVRRCDRSVGQLRQDWVILAPLALYASVPTPAQMSARSIIVILVIVVVPTGAHLLQSFPSPLAVRHSLEDKRRKNEAGVTCSKAAVFKSVAVFSTKMEGRWQQSKKGRGNKPNSVKEDCRNSDGESPKGGLSDAHIGSILKG